jgi:Mrp family chromosome partitioning ATPase
VDDAAGWLDSLRLTFDSVLLDCPAAETAPAAAQLAALADAAMLVVEAGRTSRQQIQRDQRALQLRGVKLAGCILIGRR